MKTLRTSRFTPLLSFFIAMLLASAGCNNVADQSIEDRERFQEIYEQKKDHSDKKAIKLAIQVQDSSGGYETWQNKRYLSWIFFDTRSWIWDKKTGDVRINSLEKDQTILMNLNSREGKVKKGGKQVTNPDSLEKYLDMGYNLWANDSYWLFMPFKMLDPGVRLKYVGEKTTMNDYKADVVELTFDSVGITPQNKYHVYIGKEDKLVRQWDYYSSAEKEEPAIRVPWTHYNEFNGLKLSMMRGGNARITNISVRDSLNREVFKKFNPYPDSTKKQDNRRQQKPRLP